MLGCGAVGTRAARQLVESPDIDRVVLFDPDTARVDAVLTGLTDQRAERVADASAALDAGVTGVVLAGPVGLHESAAREALARGLHVVSASDAVGDVKALLDLDSVASAAGLSVVAGAAFAPGLSCLLAVHAAASFDQVDEVHVAKVGTGGPACARQHHAALSADALDYRDGEWLDRPGGSGRELCWFPDPVAAVDCYRAGLPDALVLVPAFPGVQRVTARVGASRRDRFTAWLPMLRRPHSEGTVGAIRVEVRGLRAGHRITEVLGAFDRPASAAGAVAAVAMADLCSGRGRRSGAGGIAEMLEAGPLLRELTRRGVKSAVFAGD